MPGKYRVIFEVYPRSGDSILVKLSNGTETPLFGYLSSQQASQLMTEVINLTQENSAYLFDLCRRFGLRSPRI